jgi:hypothetical protein
MAEFKPQVPVVQTDPLVSVDVKQGSPLPPGKYRFQLVVVDDADNESDAAFLDVIIRDTQRPTAVLDMVNSDKAVINPVVGVGASFLLSGARSSDVPPGKVKSYRFTLIDAPGVT